MILIRNNKRTIFVLFCTWVTLCKPPKKYMLQLELNYYNTSFCEKVYMFGFHVNLYHSYFIRWGESAVKSVVIGMVSKTCRICGSDEHFKTRCKLFYNGRGRESMGVDSNSKSVKVQNVMWTLFTLTFWYPKVTSSGTLKRKTKLLRVFIYNEAFTGTYIFKTWYKFDLPSFTQRHNYVWFALVSTCTCMLTTCTYFLRSWFTY
jgi:hypothetical protein